MIKKIIISSLIIFILSFLFHSVYDIFPSTLTSLFFPVNESIWEHNKMVFISYIVYMLILFIYYKKDKKNILFYTLISFLICVIFLTTTYSYIYLILMNKKHSVLITLIVYLISIVISQMFSLKILDKKYNIKKEKVSLICIGVIFFIFIYFTYVPLNIPLMYDYTKNKYGI